MVSLSSIPLSIATGMNRIGVSCDEAVEFIKKVREADYLDFRGVFTHLANAEVIEKTQIQIDRWNSVISKISTEGLLLHILNTAGAMCYDVPNSNMRRAGIALYGLYPDLPDNNEIKKEFDNSDESNRIVNNMVRKPDLKPLLSLKARIVNIHSAKDGEGVSYGHTFVASGTRKIATVPLGYADGVPRALSNKISGILNGQRVPQVGNITMDQMMFDITGVDASLGDVITMLDEENTIDEWAKIVGTINYELTCRLKVRLPRVYTR